MADQTLKNTNISELPDTGDIRGDDYIIVHNSEITTKIKFKDVFITKENTTFGQEINDLYEKLEGLKETVNNMQQMTQHIQDRRWMQNLRVRLKYPM